jgi:hypothetical protein
VAYYATDLDKLVGAVTGLTDRNTAVTSAFCVRSVSAVSHFVVAI